MVFAQIGPLTGLLESFAAAVGAGMLLGGFAAGLVALIRGWPRRLFDRSVLESSYAGGAVAIIVILADITFHHAF
jgi:hypothetical protein